MPYPYLSTFLHLLPLRPAVAGGGGGTVDLPGSAAVALSRYSVNHNELRFASARELELAFRSPPLAGRTDFSRHGNVIHVE